jgi:hypothetical protein
MMFIQGISKFTIADMADKTPLDEIGWPVLVIEATSLPEEFVLVLHELGLYKVYGTCSNTHPGEILNQGWQKGMMGIKFNLTC